MAIFYSYRKNISKFIRNRFKRILLTNQEPYKKFVSFKILAYHGLGNQLFQYAVARSYAIKYDVPLILQGFQYHRLADFNINCHFVPFHDLNIIKKNNFYEKVPCYDKNLFRYKRRKYLIGFFQTEKYFLDNKNILMQELSLNDTSIINYCNDYINLIRAKHPGKKIVSLHNRRGDNVPSQMDFNDRLEGSFLKDKALYHPLLSMEYIHSAMSYFKDEVFLVFSNNDDDVQWCENNIIGDNIYFSKGHNDLIDFSLMRICDHNIIANSTFSWWAAWLNQNPNKIIIAPKIWFGEAYSHINSTDLIPNSWIII